MKINPNDPVAFIPYHGTGISMRQYFAALAMQGLISGDINASFMKEVTPYTPSGIALRAVQYADELINELNKTDNEEDS